jgi:7-carboxy-7-deazaguanine synthase
MGGDRTMVLKINEIFRSIQGEGAYAGLPTTFIRLQGCNLYPLNCCSYCDTGYAQSTKDSSSKFYTVPEIVTEIVELDPRANYHDWVCISGGEPLLQEEELKPLVRYLSQAGWYIEIETNGTLPKPKWWTLATSWVPDVKCPSSGVHPSKVLIDDWFNTRPQDQIKFVVSDEADLFWAEKVIRDHSTSNPQVLISPVAYSEHSSFNYPDKYPTIVWTLDRELMNDCVELCKTLKVRFSLQIHKLVWGNKKGV